MAASAGVPDSLDPSQSGLAATLSLEQRLEQGDIIYYPECPFPLPAGDDRQFLLTQRLGGRRHKNISYNPETGQAAGFQRQSAAQVDRLAQILAAYSRSATAWLADALPRYSQNWRLDRASFRPEEEALRHVRQTARDDLLHIDAFPSRPTQGRVILRCYVNINPTEPRVWITSEPFGKLLERYGRQAGLLTQARLDWPEQIRDRVLGLFDPERPRRSAYDAFMLKFHHFLKANEHFQDKAPKRCWSFAPGSCWLLLADITSHAALRGRYALEHSYFVAPQVLADPEAAPIAILERMSGVDLLNRAA